MSTQYKSFASQAITSNSSVVISAPSGITDGEVLVAIIGYDNTSVSISAAPSGWTLVGSAGSGGSIFNTALALYWKVASSESGSYTWTLSSGAASGGGILRLGSTSTSPIDVSSLAGSSPTPVTSISASGVTPTTNNGIIIAASMVARDVSVPSNTTAQAIATDNPTWVELLDSSVSGGVSYLLNIVYGVRPQTTATGSYSATTDQAFIRLATCLAFIKRVGSQTFSESVTCSDVATGSAGFKLTVSDTVTATDTITDDEQKTWATQTKSSTTWLNQNKS